MNTEKKILSLVNDYGFKLPPYIQMGDGQLTVYSPCGGVEYELLRQRLYDECACWFARQMKKWHVERYDSLEEHGLWHVAKIDFNWLMGRGETELAITKLHEAHEAEKTLPKE